MHFLLGTKITKGETDVLTCNGCSTKSTKEAVLKDKNIQSAKNYVFFVRLWTTPLEIKINDSKEKKKQESKEVKIDCKTTPSQITGKLSSRI